MKACLTDAQRKRNKDAEASIIKNDRNPCKDGCQFNHIHTATNIYKNDVGGVSVEIAKALGMPPQFDDDGLVYHGFRVLSDEFCGKSGLLIVYVKHYYSTR